MPNPEKRVANSNVQAFIPDNDLHLLAAQAIKNVYDGVGINKGSTEWNLSTVKWKGQPVQILAIGGSNEIIDWLWNFVPASWDGVKFCSYLSSNRVKKGAWINYDLPLVVAGHSKSGPTALYYADKYASTYCLAFCPARGFRELEKMDNATIFIDPNDPVPKLGKLRFKLKDCKIIKLPDENGWDFSDHVIDHVIKWLKQLCNKG